MTLGLVSLHVRIYTFHLPYIGVRPFLIAVPCVIALAMVFLVGLTIKLFGEFGWTVYKHIGASVQMRRRYLIYQIFVALLKFDFFFCVTLSLLILFF